VLTKALNINSSQKDFACSHKEMACSRAIENVLKKFILSFSKKVN